MIEYFFYWPLFAALFHTPEAKVVLFWLLIVTVPPALCYIGTKVFLIGVRR